MKKLLMILVMLFWCNTSFAITQQSAIEDYLSDHKLENIEGIWIESSSGTVFAVYKSGTSSPTYVSKRISGDASLGWLYLEKGSSKLFYGVKGCALYYSNGSYSGMHECSVSVEVTKNKFRRTYTIPSGMIPCNGCEQSNQTIWSRVWPEDIDSHNAKFGGETEPTQPSEEISGTAFFVTPKGHLITNYHVVKKCNDKSKISFEDKDIKAKLLAKDKYLDLALLKADIKNKHFIKISNKAPKKLQRIIVAGYPLGKELSDDLKFTSGIVSSLKGLEDDSTRIQIDAALNPGNSGGPIVNEKNGELIAVAVSGLSETQSINFGIKAGSVKNFLESNQVDISLKASKYSFGSADLSDILENATVYTFCK